METQKLILMTKNFEKALKNAQRQVRLSRVGWAAAIIEELFRAFAAVRNMKHESTEFDFESWKVSFKKKCETLLAKYHIEDAKIPKGVVRII